MAISIKNFGGIVPKINPDALPDNAAQSALNVDLTSGALVPISVTGSTTALHNSTSLNADLTTDEVVLLGKPTTITAATPFVKLCRPLESGHVWLAIKRYTYLYQPQSDGTIDITEDGAYLTSLSVEYTTYGMIIHGTVPNKAWSITTEDGSILHASYGPRYAFEFTADSGGTYGGPTATQNFPATMTATNPVFPSDGPALYDGTKLYGVWNVVDAQTPIWDEEFSILGGGTKTFTGGTVHFIINLNYLEPGQRYYKFVQTHIDSEEREGQPSDASAVIVVNAGEKLKINTALDGYSKSNIYRTGMESEQYTMIVRDHAATTWTEAADGLLGDVLPNYGEFPVSPVTDASLEGSIIHPARFGVAYVNDTENTDYKLYFSDQYKFHVWPEEWAMPFDEAIKAIALVGNTIMVFSGNNVFAVSGSNPVYMGQSLLSSTMPLLNKLGLCRIGNTLFWPTTDGVAASGGGDVQNITQEYFTRKEWSAYTPADMEGANADNSLFFTGGAADVRIDLDESDKRISTYNATTGVSLVWKSKRFRHERKTLYEYARVVADSYSSVILRAYADGAAAVEFTITSAAPKALTGLTAAYDWEFEVQSSSTIRSLDVYDKNILTVGGPISLNNGNVPLWESIWLKFPDRGKFAAVSIGADDYTSVVMTATADGVTQDLDTGSGATSLTITNGNLIALPATISEGAVWNLSFVSTAKLFDVTLLPLERVPVQGNDIVVFANDTGTWPWINAIYEFPDEITFVSGIVKADSYPVTMTIAQNGGTTIASTTVNSAAEFAIDGLWRASSILINFGGNDYKVNEVKLFGRDAVPIQNNGIVMRGINETLNMRNRVFEFPDTGSFSSVRVAAADYTGMTLTLKVAGVTQQSLPITSSEEVKLNASLIDAKTWTVDLSHAGRIDEFELLGRADNRVSNGLVRLAQSESPISWLGKRIIADQRMSFSCGRIVASKYPVAMKLYRNGTLELEMEVHNRNAFRLPRMAADRLWELDVDVPADVSVSEVALATSMSRLKG